MLGAPAAGVERQLQELQRWARDFSPNSEGSRSARASGSSRACPSDVFAWQDEVGEASLQLRTSKRPRMRGRAGVPRGCRLGARC
jgi:hypothetical protein